jgi:hypothetical protein
MDSVFNLEDWLRQAGLDDGVIANVAAKLREEECASVSALKAANDASLQSIGIKVGSRNLILKACADIVNAQASRLVPASLDGSGVNHLASFSIGAASYVMMHPTTRV